MTYYPLSVGEAIEVLRRKESTVSLTRSRRNGQQTGQAHIPVMMPSTSVVGIVARSSIPSSQVGHLALRSNRTSTNRRVDVWLSDVSTFTVRFILFGVADVARVEQERIRVGDVLRFNGVALTKRAKSSYQEGTTLMELQLSLEDGEPGLRWFRLGRVDIPVQSTTSRPMFIPNDSDKGIPDNMQTSVGWLQNLVDRFYSGVGACSAESQSHFQEFQSGGGSIAPKLDPFHCKMRGLDELQSCVGLISNVRVRVTLVQCIYPSITTKSFDQRKKRQRLSPYDSPTRGLPGDAPTLAFANVVDETGTSMSLIDISGRLLPVLRDATKNDDGDKTTILLLTHVMTSYQNSLDVVIKSPADEVVLVPTNETVGLIAVDPNVPAESNKKMYLSIAQCEGATGIRSSKVSVVVATLADLSINGTLLNKGNCLESLVCYRRTMLEDDFGSFRSARILLNDTVVVGARDDNSSQNDSSISISPNVVRTLCGDLDVYELVHDDKLAHYSMLLLKALIEDCIKLLWTIVITSGGEPLATKVQLHDFRL